MKKKYSRIVQRLNRIVLGIFLLSLSVFPATRALADQVADPTQLPAAAGQLPVAGTYGRGLAAGQKYVDPNTGVTVLKLTDASTPVANTSMIHGYSEGGPTISQPWVGTDGNTYYTAMVGTYLVDIQYGTFTASNWRTLPTWGEIGFAFSLNPSTPRIGYTIGANGYNRVDRYNTATNQVENTGNWPWIINGHGDYMTWLQTNLNDQWVAGMMFADNAVVAFNPSTGAQRTFTDADLPPGHTINEPHLDREYPTIYLSVVGSNNNILANLDTGAVTIPDNAVLDRNEHVSPLRGAVVGVMDWTQYGFYYYDLLNNTGTKVANIYDVIGFPGDWHQAGQWVFNNGTGTGQWFVIDSVRRDDALAAVRLGFIAFVRSSPFEVRLIASHDSIVNGTAYTAYNDYPKPTLSPDGKLVMWTSDSNNNDNPHRVDAFIAKTPVTNVTVTKYPRQIQLLSMEGLSSIPSNQSITVTVLSGSTILSTQPLTPTAGKYTATFQSSDPQVVDIRISIPGYLSVKFTNVDTTQNSSATLTASQLPAGDFNNDNAVNSLDYSIMNSHYNQNFSQADINKDNLVNSLDFAILKNNWNRVGQ